MHPIYYMELHCTVNKTSPGLCVHIDGSKTKAKMSHNDSHCQFGAFKLFSTFQPFPEFYPFWGKPAQILKLMKNIFKPFYNI